MKIDSPSSITSREASIRLEWISTRILPGVAVLLLSIPLCQWADSNLPNGIVPAYIIYMMIVIVLWSMYMAVQYAFVGIAQTWKNKTHACNNQTATNESTAQKPVFLLEAIPVYNESEGIDTACEAETAEEISETEVIEEAYMAETGELAKDNHISVTYQQGIDDFYQSQAESQKKKLDTIHEYHRVSPLHRKSRNSTYTIKTLSLLTIFISAHQNSFLICPKRQHSRFVWV